MAITMAGFVLVTTLTALSLWHVYWACGGQMARFTVIPSVDGRPVFVPSVYATLAVAAVLMTAALVVVGHMGWVAVAPRGIYRWPTRGMAIVFLLRAIGDFRWVGFFKRIKHTPFANWDTRLFSPLCLLVSGLAMLVGWR